jgi:hypothetical protein
MSERERWIVYPLLMFALGAAVRDKLMQRVESKEIRCESLQIVDHQDPDNTLVELGIKRAMITDPTKLADRWGGLEIRDSEGRTVCDISTDVEVGRLVARQLLVIDPTSQPRVIVATETQPAFSFDQTGAYTHQGVIYLNNQPLRVRIGPQTSQPANPNRPQQPPTAQPPTTPAPAETTGQGSPPPSDDPE